MGSDVCEVWGNTIDCGDFYLLGGKRNFACFQIFFSHS